MSVFEKAKDLGNEISRTEEYKELERTSQNVQENSEANQIIQEIQDLQQKIQFAQQSGVQPSQEQVQQFNDMKNRMNSNLTIQAYAKAQESFNQLMQNVNNSITEGIKPAEGAGGEGEKPE